MASRAAFGHDSIRAFTGSIEAQLRSKDSEIAEQKKAYRCLEVESGRKLALLTKEVERLRQDNEAYKSNQVIIRNYMLKLLKGLEGVEDRYDDLRLLLVKFVDGKMAQEKLKISNLINSLKPSRLQRQQQQRPVQAWERPKPELSGGWEEGEEWCDEEFTEPMRPSRRLRNWEREEEEEEQ